MKAWNDLPSQFQNEEVRPYYDKLKKKGVSLVFKRIFDIIIALLLILILAIPMFVIAVLIKLDSSGPVFYRQERVTKYGKHFRIFKFRTMVANADKIGAHVTSNNDSRVTVIGNKLRDLRLDELPQLLNVIMGDMSFVGTRPEATRYVEKYTNEMWATLLLPAGITSEASIRYKDEAELLEKAEDADETYINQVLPAKMKYNLNSLENFSFIGDIRTMFRTIVAVLN